MWPNRVSNPGPLTYESGALPTALRGPATINWSRLIRSSVTPVTRRQPTRQRTTNSTEIHKQS